MNSPERTRTLRATPPGVSGPQHLGLTAEGIHSGRKNKSWRTKSDSVQKFAQKASNVSFSIPVSVQNLSLLAYILNFVFTEQLNSDGRVIVIHQANEFSNVSYRFEKSDLL